jgi:hypothetical protein
MWGRPALRRASDGSPVRRCWSPTRWGCKERGEFGAAAAGVRNMIGSACRIGGVSRDLGRSTEVVKVVRKLQRVGSNGLYAAKNSPSTSYQLAHLTGTTIEFQLRLEPIYLCDQLYPRFFNRPVQCAQFGGLPLEVARGFANRRVRMYLRTARPAPVPQPL